MAARAMSGSSAPPALWDMADPITQNAARSVESRDEMPGTLGRVPPVFPAPLAIAPPGPRGEGAELRATSQQRPLRRTAIAPLRWHGNVPATLPGRSGRLKGQRRRGPASRSDRGHPACASKRSRGGRAGIRRHTRQSDWPCCRASPVGDFVITAGFKNSWIGPNRDSLHRSPTSRRKPDRSRHRPQVSGPRP